MMKIDVLTLFPEMFAPMQSSIMGKAQAEGHIQFSTYNFREYAVNKHGHVDDYPYGGGPGMLLRVEPIVNQLEAIEKTDNARIILVDPIGVPFSQQTALDWSKADQLIFICGHYEGFDERIRDYVTDEVSLGDYVLTNGELPAMVMIDATVRLIPEVVGNAESIETESHRHALLEQPQYTRPRDFRGAKVPDILLSGDHSKIAAWQRRASIQRTVERRPDLIGQADLSAEELKYVEEMSKKAQETDKSVRR